MIKKNIHQYLIWLFILIVVASGVYYPALKIQYFSDDYHHVFNKPYHQPGYYFTHQNPRNLYAYRPIQSIIMVWIQQNFGLNTVPIHLIKIFFHIFLSWIIFIIIIRLGFEFPAAILGSLYMLLTQANAAAVLNVDTISQTGGALFGILTVWMLYNAHSRNNLYPLYPFQVRPFFIILGACFFLLAIFFKETCVAYMLVSFCMLFIIYKLYNISKIKFRLLWKYFIRLMPLLVVFAFFMLMRNIAGVSYDKNPECRYAFEFGINIPVNIFRSLFASVVPFSSVDVFTSFQKGETLKLIYILISTGILIVIPFIGIIKWKMLTFSTALIIFSIISLLPMIVMKHASELYVYQATPFISILMGIGYGWYLKNKNNNKYLKLLILIILIAMFSSHISALRSKARLMRHNGELATSLINQIMPFIERVPPSGQLILLNPSSDLVEYSVYTINGFNALEESEKRFYQLSGRNDFEVKRVEKEDFSKFEPHYPRLILTLEGDKVVLYKDEIQPE